MSSAVTSETTKSRPAKPTKVQAILKLLNRPKGASLGALEKATGWKPHSVRAALSGLRKSGHSIERSTDNKGVTIYKAAGNA